jgi:endonuclease III
VARRLGYGSRAPDGRWSDKAVQRALRRELPRDVGAMRHARVYLAHHASATCTERDPHCRVCPLLTDCPHGQQLHGPPGLPETPLTNAP